MASFSGIVGIVFSCIFGVAVAQLSSDFYATSCPKALSIINDTVVKAVQKELRMGASLLRLQFHDCFVNGCDGSVLLDQTSNITGEKDALQNQNSLRGFEVVDDIKAELEHACPGVVSCADILTVAARDSVVALGGPSWAVELGRRDSLNASKEAAEKDLPVFSHDLETLTALFARKGFNASELVILSGGHTIGSAACVTYRVHIYNDTYIDPVFRQSLQSICKFRGPIDPLAALDNTADVFDNEFFKDLLHLKGVLRTDQVLYHNATTDELVKTYSNNSALFFSDFGAAMVKLGKLDVLLGSQGQIRTNCRKVNE